MAAHTPGPWLPDLGGNGSFAIAIQPAGDMAWPCTVAQRGPWTTNAEQSHANARLISAAPELLAALLLAYRHLNGGSDSLSATEHKQAFQMARAAIAKATGEEA